MATIAGDLANIEAVLCSMQAVESFLLIQSEPTAISKAIMWLSNQSHMTHLEYGSPELEKELKGDDLDHPATRQLEKILNPKCMTIQDWVEAQSKDKIISEIFQLFKSKKLCYQYKRQ